MIIIITKSLESLEERSKWVGIGRKDGHETGLGMSEGKCRNFISRPGFN
jgi:hypothetical protein